MDIFEIFNIFFIFILLLSLFFLVVIFKKILFWFYLLQLKEYHIGRFLDHFRTEKGKTLLLNRLIFFKIILLLLFISFYFVPTEIENFDQDNIITLVVGLVLILGIVYLVEALRAIQNFFQKTLLTPVFTKKIIILSLITLSIYVFIILFLFLQKMDIIIGFLVLDILTPLIVSCIVLIFQPLAVLGRNQIIRKAIKKRERFKDLLVIGITGSYGKTSTKEFLATILSEKFNVLKTKEHQNSEIGISQCILNDLKEGYEIFICEMGAYNRGGIKLLCDISKPKIGILTGINEQHMATFGSQENIIKTKFELIESLPEDGVAFFNTKNKYCLELYQKTKIKKYLYGQAAKFFGQENLLGAVAVAKELGMTEQEISLACQKIENKLPGIQLKKGVNGLTVLDATYSANPDGVIGHLEYLKTFPNKKVIVMPCLIELGKATIEVHKRIGRKIGEVCDLAIITTKERFKEIKEGAGEKALFIENPKEIFEKIKTFCNEGDVVLLESRVPESLIKQLNIS